MICLLIVSGVVIPLALLLVNLPACFEAILNDARMISLDPALASSYEILYAYPGFWALFWHRMSHELWARKIPFISSFVPRLAMSLVRYGTAIDIHPEAQISKEGVLLDHGTGIVIGATAIVGGRVTLYHGVTLGSNGKPVPPGAKRHPTVQDGSVIGAGAKILGDIIVGREVLVGANSVVTKAVPANHTAVGIPARILCHGTGTGKDVTGAAICELHQRLSQVEERAAPRTSIPVAIVADSFDKHAGEHLKNEGSIVAPSPFGESSSFMDVTSSEADGREMPTEVKKAEPLARTLPTAKAFTGGAPFVARSGFTPKDVRREESPFLSSAHTSEWHRDGAPFSAVEEVMYSMRAMGQDALAVY